MLYGVISDTHLHLAHGDSLPEWVVDAFHGVDLILHAGDIVDRETVEALEAIAPICVVRGNMDHFPPDGDFPLHREIPLGGSQGTIVIAHRPETLQHALERLSGQRHHEHHGHHDHSGHRGTAIGIHGHTHLAAFRKMGSFWVLNPGSPTHPRGGQSPSVALLTIDAEGIPQAVFKYPPECADE